MRQTNSIRPLLVLLGGVGTAGAIVPLLTACGQSTEEEEMPQPPVAETRSHTYEHHEIKLNDPYHWLKDQSYPDVDDKDVLEYLEKENEYYAAFTNRVEPLVDQIFEELKGRLDPDDESVPSKDGKYIYQGRYQSGQQYQIHVRWPAESADEDLMPLSEDQIELLLDENELAGDSDYFRRGSWSMSPNDELLAYSTDHSGSERYTLVIRDLNTGELLEDVIENTYGSVVWANDNKSFLYVDLDEQLRPNRILHHVLGTDVSEDRVVYVEEDPGFFVGLDRTTSRKFALIQTDDHVTSEVMFIALDDLSQAPTVISPRRVDHTYSVDHRQGKFVIRTNDTHKNFRIVSAPDTAYEPENWESLLEPSDSRHIGPVQALEDRIVVGARENGLDQVLISTEEGEFESIPFDEPAYSAGFHFSAESNPTHIRIGFSSLVTPQTTFDYSFADGTTKVRKTQKIPSGYSRDLYESQRRIAVSHDGVEVPVSIVYRKDTPLDGTAPLHLYGYGAYGYSSDPYFSTSVFSLLDRGFVYAIAHIRGGSEMGYHWYEAGKLDQRMNTFLDFIAVAQYLVDQDFTSEGQIAIRGGSAGGTLMGVVANLEPKLWGAVVAAVPFVDVLNTMLDESLPLTPMEWPEWGNPITSKEDFEYILSYSPYDQISAQDYPPMLVTAGLNDPRVTYWEPAKYVAKLRVTKTDTNPLLLRTEMGAGHGGKSGRFDSLREVAEAYAFMITSMDVESNASQ